MTLVGELAEPDADALRSELNRQGIAASTVHTTHGYELEVAESSVARAVAALRFKPLPPSLGAHAQADALVNTRNMELRAQTQALRAELERSISKLAGVRSCSVQLELPAPDRRLTDLLQPSPPAAPHVVITVTSAADRTVDQQQLQQLVRHTPGLAQAVLELAVHAGETACVPCAELAHLGALTVTASSMTTLKQWLGASLLVHMLGALTLLVMTRRRRAP